MCLHPRSVDPVPEETARVAKAAFPKGTTYMTMRDELGAIFEDEDFAHLFPRRGQPAMAPWRLALVTISCSSPKDSLRPADRRCGARPHRLEIRPFPGTRRPRL